MTIRKIKKVLIANRGEIALRIKRACDKLELKTVFIASTADKDSLFARKSEELVIIGPAPATESYLAIDKIIKAALEHNVDAIHPGYGFLSENAEFAQRVIEAGLVFIGPNPESIRTLGSKTEARAAVMKNGVPCVPGSGGDLTDAELLVTAEQIGFPVIIKAVGGGGGRGMRVVHNKDEMTGALLNARAESKKNFASSAVFIERYIEQPRHVEVQVFGDAHGNIIHLGTRDCSTQRRHQKLVEEAPAPDLNPELREAIHAAAVNAARSVSYKNAGTAEFLVVGEDFYFLEMNTRIQVEHPVTEAITGIDLVELQLMIAQGEKLPYSQSQIEFNGHAIEFRIYAEDPAESFRPSIGKLTKLVRPTDNSVREDFAFEQGDEVKPYYDAMLSKVIVHGPDRKEAITSSKNHLKQYQIDGVRTTILFHRWLLQLSPFKDGPVDIGYVEREFGQDSLKDLRASEIKDPRHQPPIGGAEVKNIYKYKSNKYNQTYTIEILHRSDGFFLATPIDSLGRRAANKNCRMSNGLDTVVKSLISDVLEKTPPTELFSN